MTVMSSHLPEPLSTQSPEKAGSVTGPVSLGIGRPVAGPDRTTTLVQGWLLHWSSVGPTVEPLTTFGTDDLYQLTRLLLEQRRAEAAHERVVAHLPHSNVFSAVSAMSRELVCSRCDFFGSRAKQRPRSGGPSLIRGAAKSSVY